MDLTHVEFWIFAGTLLEDILLGLSGYQYSLLSQLSLLPTNHIGGLCDWTSTSAGVGPAGDRSSGEARGLESGSSRNH